MFHSANAWSGVVVTARRKKEAVEVVPISMTVLSGEKLAEAGLYRAQDIQEKIPNLVVSVPNARLTSYTIRGLGSSSANDGLESSVGLMASESHSDCEREPFDNHLICNDVDVTALEPDPTSRYVPSRRRDHRIAIDLPT